MAYDYMTSQLSVVLLETKRKNIKSGVKVKFNSDFGVTNWLSVSDETFKKVQAILIEDGG